MSRKLFSSLVLALGAMAFQPSGAAVADPVTFTPFTVNLPNAIFPQLNGIDGNRVVGEYFDTGLGAIGGFYYDGTTFTALGQDRIANGISGTTIVGEYNDSGFSYDTGSQAFTSYLYPGSTSTALTAIDGTRVVGYWSDGQQGQGLVYDAVTTNYFSFDGAPLGATYLYPLAVYGDYVGGWYQKNSSDSYGFLYQISSDSYSNVENAGWTDVKVTGISGTILVGSYTDLVDNQTHAFVYEIATGDVYAPLNATGSDPANGSATGGASGNTFVGTAQDANFDTIAYIATYTPTAVPEIDPAGMGSVAALVTGALGLIERRRLKAKAA